MEIFVLMIFINLFFPHCTEWAQRIFSHKTTHQSLLHLMSISSLYYFEIRARQGLLQSRKAMPSLQIKLNRKRNLYILKKQPDTYEQSVKEQRIV